MNTLLAFCPTCKKDTEFQRTGITMRCQSCGFSYDIQMDPMSGEPKVPSRGRKVLDAIVFVVLLLGGLTALAGAIFFVGCLINMR